MLEKWQNLLKDLKIKKHKDHMSLEFIQSVFEMQDVNKWLKFNATSKTQLERAQNVEATLQALMEKLYVPDYQSENV